MDELKFRNLVTNQFMENIDYSREKYSFLTVFYMSSSTYCCCGCAQVHEYLEYISDTGEVDENVYENIVQSLAKGRCPHADMVSDYQLRPTSVTAMHIAAAVGMARAVIENRYICFSYAQMLVGGIFNLYPFDTAMLKKQTHICNLLADYWLSHDHGPIVILKVSTVHDSSLHVQEVSRLEICVRQRNNQLLQAITTSFSKIPGFGDIGLKSVKLILAPRLGLAYALQFTMKYDLVAQQQTLVQYMQLLKDYNLLSVELKIDCLLSVLMYNKHKVLKQMLTFLDFNDSNDNKFISKCCIVLQKRGECTNLLHHHRVIEPVSMSREEHIHTIFALFCMFYNDFKDELYRLLETAPGIQQGFVRVALLKQIPFFFRRYMYGHRNCIVKLAQTINELGNSETLVSDAEIIVPQLQRMLKENSKYGMYSRKAVELLVAENVDFGNKIGYRLEVPLHEVRPYNYTTDVREHGMYGHDGEDLALNCVYPFLLECGYDIPRCILHDVLDEKSNTESESIEVAYIINYLETPRSLQTCCRNTLRNHFRGRYIHRFVEVSGCPQKIKDFILLKHLLRCLR